MIKKSCYSLVLALIIVMTAKIDTYAGLHMRTPSEEERQAFIEILSQINATMTSCFTINKVACNKNLDSIAAEYKKMNNDDSAFINMMHMASQKNILESDLYSFRKYYNVILNYVEYKYGVNSPKSAEIRKFLKSGSFSGDEAQNTNYTDDHSSTQPANSIIGRWYSNEKSGIYEIIIYHEIGFSEDGTWISKTVKQYSNNDKKEQSIEAGEYTYRNGMLSLSTSRWKDDYKAKINNNTLTLSAGNETILFYRK